VADAGVEKLLRWSVWGAVAFAVLALVWGFLARSQMIVFDGMYSSISVGLSALSLVAYRAIQRGPDDRYPFGRDVMGSLVIVVKGVAIAALCLYALTGAVLDIIAGGRAVAVGSAATYAAVATLGCALMVLMLRRGSRRGTDRSDLLEAEAAQWLLDTLLSAAVLVGFGVAVVMELRGRTDLSVYVDPVLVGAMSLVFLALPVRLVREGLRGVLATAPEAEVQADIERAVLQVAAGHGITATATRVTTFGERFDVTVTFLLEGATTGLRVAAFDRIRAELDELLRALPHGLIVTVSFTADHRFVGAPTRRVPDSPTTDAAY
jgi:predicted Co/Zn/Cd cation transporter (cation efflux family)